MRILYHWPLDPLSRQVRIVLGEKQLKFQLEPISPWKITDEFLALSPEGRPPVFMNASTTGRTVIAGARAICEYVEETNSKAPMLPGSATERAEIRRLCDWFNHKFCDEVSAYIMHEKVEKYIIGHGKPDLGALRSGRDHLRFHLDYMDWLLEQREWLAGAQCSLADICAGAHLSCLDFVGEVNWKDHPRIKEWYQMFKSRPSVQPLLSDQLPGIIPPRYYANLDF
ncbi:MAG: glutathione S-transferase family protein [Hyphomonadaceae bacterium]|nr:glutathione S-transferase family protein [Hyphomonadaceae bacterium]MBC6412679.1 glutathione S-transferase family protein [Hyphomonadaceae bacterium]